MSEAPKQIWLHPAAMTIYVIPPETNTLVQYVRADIYARLQEQVETLTKERDANHHMAVANGQRAKDEHYRAEAAEAKRDRLREAPDKIAEADFEQSKSELHDFVTDIALAALQKEPQP